MLAQRNRLRKAGDFALAVKGRRVSGENFLLYVATPPHGEHTGAPVKVGLIVGKNVGGSVMRHRISRQVRHAIAPHLSHFPDGSLVVLRAHPGAARNAEQSLNGEIAALVTKYVAQGGTR